MKNKKILKELGKIDDDILYEANTIERGKRALPKFRWVKWATIVACFVFTAVIGYSFNKGDSSDFYLNLSSKNIKIKYVNNISIPLYSANLINMTEEEIFHKYDTYIFKGTIEDIANIQINFNGEKDYRAIAKINIDIVYRGNVNIGDTLSVLLPCPINTNMRVEDTDVISSIRVGTTGIFMPTPYDLTSIYEMNGEKLCLLDIANSGFLDGQRFAFLDTEKGLVFNKASFLSIAKATTLEDVEQYIKEMIQ